MNLEPVGVVRSCFGGKFGTPRQPGLCPSAWGELCLNGSLASPESLRGLEGFSHIWLIFGFHQTVDHGWNPTVRPPRLGGNRRVGVFASRSTFRPNGLGLSLVRLEGIDSHVARGPRLRLGGLDLIDGTPVYDIKPYLPYAEAVPDARAGFAAAEIPRLTVLVAEDASAAFARLPDRSRALIFEALALDPRPPVRQDDRERIFGAPMCGHNVRFEVTGKHCRILEITPQEGAGLASPIDPA